MADNTVFGKTFPTVEIVDSAGSGSPIDPNIKEFNNVKIIDPNPNGQMVALEDLYIYVNLKAVQKSKSLLTVNTNGQVSVDPLEQNTVNIGIPQQQAQVINNQTLFKSKPFLTTDWTEIGGNQTQVGVDHEGFGITNIDIEIKSQTTPKVVIDFVDIRGATLFEQGSCSPYGLFFNLPYPIFELKVKGYYGKAVNYYLNMVKFNARFNSETGNMECRAEFIGYSFAFLSDMIVSYIAASQYLPTGYDATGKLRTKYEQTTNYYKNKLNLDITNVWCDNAQTGEGRCTTIQDLINSISQFDLNEKANIAGAPDYKELNDLIELKQSYLNYKNVIVECIKNLNNNNSLVKRIEQTKSKGKNINQPLKFVFSSPNLSSLIQILKQNNNTIYDYFNKEDGKILNTIKDVLTKKVGTLNPFDLKDTNGKNISCGLKNTSQFATVNGTPSQKGYTLFDNFYFTTSPWFYGVLSSLNYGDQPTALSDVDKSSNQEKDKDGLPVFYIDFGYILDDIDRELDILIKQSTKDDPSQGILTKKRKDIIEAINKIISDKIGFKPTIRNIFTVLLCNTDAFMEILLDVAKKAEKYHQDNPTNASNVTSSNQELTPQSGNYKIYPWPTVSQTTFDGYQQGEKEIYPGSIYPDWVEVKFVEDFLKAFLDFKNAVDVTNGNTEDKPGFDNYAPISPLESRIWPKINDTGIKYFSGDDGSNSGVAGNEEIYKIIGERLFLALDHSLFQRIRTTPDSQLISKSIEGTIPANPTGDWQNVIKNLGEVEACNLISTIDNQKRLDGLIDTNSDSPTAFIQNIKTQLQKGIWLETQGNNIKKYGVNTPDGSENYYVYKTKDEGILIKKDVWVHPNPYKMGSEYLIQIIPEDKIGTSKITLNSENDVQKTTIEVIDNYNKSLLTATKNVNFSTTNFNPNNSKVKDSNAYPNFVSFDKDQNLISFENGQLYSSLAMITPKNEYSNWWLDPNGSFSVQTQSTPKLGSIVSNMGMMTYWDSSGNNGINWINFKAFAQGGTFLTVSTNYEVSLENPNSSNGEETKTTDILNVAMPLITTPMWLDNVNNFRKNKGNNFILPDDVEKANLAYLFLHTLKSSPLVTRLINDNGYLYETDGNNKSSAIWSLRAFNTVGGLAKVPKAWVLGLGAQLWRWKNFVGTKTINNKEVWNKPLTCVNCSGGDMPTGSDPLVQPGYNSHDGLNRVGGNGDTFRNNPKNYLESIYGGTYGTDYQQNLYKSVFGHDTQKVKLGQSINGVGGEWVDFKYFTYLQTSGKDIGKIGNYITGSTTFDNLTTNYSWPQVYIAPHHTPYVAPEVFDDPGDGDGANFVFITDDWVGEQDYQTIMPETINKLNYRDGGPEGSTDNTKRSKELDGNLGMVIQYLPDDIKNEFVNLFLNWVNSDWLEILKKVDPVNFDTKLTDTYSYQKGDNTPAMIVDFSFFGLGGDNNTALTLNPEIPELLGLLTNKYWILNSTPKIWYGYGDDTQTGSNPQSNQFYEDGFVVSQKQFDLYLSSFYTRYRDLKNKKKAELVKTQIQDNPLNETMTEDGDVKLSLYRTFKSLTDKWISASDTTDENGSNLFFNVTSNNPKSTCGDANIKSTLASHFQYVNRVMGDIGSLSVIDITRLKELKDNFGMSLYQYLSDLLIENEFLFFPLPTYVNFGSRSDKDNTYLKEMFKPSLLDITDISCGPLFMCMYVGGSSRQLKFKGSHNCKIEQGILNQLADDSFSFDDPNLPSDIGSPNNLKPDSEGYLAFKVLYGIQNQSHFKNIQLDQSEFSETAESLMVIDKLAQHGGTDRTTKGQNLNTAYLTRSYTCTVESMGNMMIQPMTYFDLQGVPMFSGAYLITEVRHNIKPNNATTTFKGVRQPRATVPLVTDAAIAMNINFKDVTPNQNAPRLVKTNENTNNNNTTNDSQSFGNGGWRYQINPTASDYSDITKDTTPEKIVDIIQKGVEGGYYHPVHWYSPTLGNQGTQKKFNLFDNSGETMFGEDRAAGQTERLPKGAEFWSIIDQNSGYGHYGTLQPIAKGNGTSKDNYSRKHRTSSKKDPKWDLDILSNLYDNVLKPGTGWKYNYTPPEPLASQLKQLSKEIILEDTNYLLDLNFKGQDDLKNLIKTDGRLYFAFVRARFNGSGYFQEFSKDLIKFYKKNPSATTDQLIAANLDYRWEYATTLKNKNSTILIQNDTTKIAQIIGWPKSNIA